MTFTLEELYGMSREEYLTTTGITRNELLCHLIAEVSILQANYELVQVEFQHGGLITDDDQRYRAKLLKEISGKIERKSLKIKDLKRNVIES